MDSIEHLIEYMEHGTRHPEGPADLYDAAESLRSNGKYYIDVWASLKEFQRPKLMRGNTIPDAASTEEDKNIYVSIKTKQENEHNGHTDIPEDTQQE